MYPLGSPSAAPRQSMYPLGSPSAAPRQSWERLPLGEALVHPVPESHRVLPELPAEIHDRPARPGGPAAGKVHQARLEILHDAAQGLDVLQDLAHLDAEPIEALRARLPVHRVAPLAARAGDARPDLRSFTTPPRAWMSCRTWRTSMPSPSRRSARAFQSIASRRSPLEPETRAPI